MKKNNMSIESLIPAPKYNNFVCSTMDRIGGESLSTWFYVRKEDVHKCTFLGKEVHYDPKKTDEIYGIEQGVCLVCFKSLYVKPGDGAVMVKVYPKGTPGESKTLLYAASYSEFDGDAADDYLTTKEVVEDLRWKYKWDDNWVELTPSLFKERA